MDIIDRVQMKESTDEIENDRVFSAFDSIQFSHEELMKLTKEAVNKIISSDTLLNGLPCDPTLEEIKAQIAVAQGQAITLYLDCRNLPKLAIVVPPHNTTVLDLKRAIKRQTNLSLQRSWVMKKISWKHVWKTYHLCCNDITLVNERETLHNYGIHNRDELKYVKKRREKSSVMRIT